jgi:hypothetical protein
VAEEKLKLGKGAAFVKSRLKRLPQVDETWEADFEALPKPIMQNDTHYMGMVVPKKGDSLLSDMTVHGRPSVNDLATLLANAMRRPLDGDARRPRLVRLRGHHQWRELFPVLKELGVEVSVERKLPSIEKAYQNHLRRLRDERREEMVRPSDEQAQVEGAVPRRRQVGDGVRLDRDRRAGAFRLRRQGAARGRHPGRGHPT